MNYDEMRHELFVFKSRYLEQKRVNRELYNFIDTLLQRLHDNPYALDDDLYEEKKSLDVFC